jgi:hypothetical protein
VHADFKILKKNKNEALWKKIITNGRMQTREIKKAALISVHKVRKNIPPTKLHETTRTTDESEKLPPFTASF